MLKVPPSTTVKHGTTTMYSYGCRCSECRAAVREERRSLPAQGKCRNCFGSPLVTDTMCARCRDLIRAGAARQYAKRKAGAAC